MAIETILLIGSVLVLLSLFISRLVDNLGLPALLLFLGVGMLSGSDGLGGLHFDNPHLARSVGVVALVFILFSGGLETDWKAVRPVFKAGLSLATLGVILTATLVGLFAHYALHFPLWMSFLLGAIVSSTDAAAVFSILKSQHTHLKSGLKPLLEFESGTNDPMAIFLTIACIELVKSPEKSAWLLGLLFLKQMVIGGTIGAIAGWLMKELLNRLRFTHEGIYGVFSLAFAFFVFGGVDLLGGSGFLAVYLTGIIAGNSNIIQRKTLVRFWDSQAWLSQIAMFLTLGLFVFPSKLPPILVPGILISVFLILVARPVAVFVSLARSGFGFRKKLFLSWVGIRGAAPIILATFPLTAAVPQAEGLFHIVFFTVLISALAQGWSLPLVARLLGLQSKSDGESKSPIETRLVEGWDGETTDLIIPFGSVWAGKSVVEIPLPEETLLLLVCRDGKYIVPSGGTILQELDVVTLLLKKQNLGPVGEIFSRAKA